MFFMRESVTSRAPSFTFIFIHSGSKGLAAVFFAKKVTTDPSSLTTSSCIRIMWFAR